VWRVQQRGWRLPQSDGRGPTTMLEEFDQEFAALKTKVHDLREYL
jgi:hypothetical protein